MCDLVSFGHRQTPVIPSLQTREETYLTPPRGFLCPFIFSICFISVNLKKKPMSDFSIR